jgi:hypothetical protein
MAGSVVGCPTCHQSVQLPAARPEFDFSEDGPATLEPDPAERWYHSAFAVFVVITGGVCLGTLLTGLVAALYFEIRIRAQEEKLKKDLEQIERRLD